MSISLNDHERRIKALENRMTRSDLKFITKDYIDLQKTSHVKMNISEFVEYDFICVSYDCWGRKYHSNITNYPLLTNFNIIPIELLKLQWVVSSEIWSYEYSTTDGITMHIDPITKILELKSAGYDGNSGVWWIAALKIYYIFRYNILAKFIRSINSRLIKFTQKFISDLF